MHLTILYYVVLHFIGSIGTLFFYCLVYFFDDSHCHDLCSTAQYSAVQSSASKYSTIHCSTLKYIVTNYDKVIHCAVQYSTVDDSTIQFLHWLFRNECICCIKCICCYTVYEMIIQIPFIESIGTLSFYCLVYFFHDPLCHDLCSVV